MKTRRPNLTAARAMVDRAYRKPCGIQIAVAMFVIYGGSLLLGLLLCAVVLDRAKAWGLIH